MRILRVCVSWFLGKENTPLSLSVAFPFSERASFDQPILEKQKRSAGRERGRGGASRKKVGMQKAKVCARTGVRLRVLSKHFYIFYLARIKVEGEEEANGG